jgi:YfiH family protein
MKQNFFESNLLKSDNIAHRFFTRNGGFSTGIFSSLNLYGKRGDNVSRNKEVIAKSFGLSLKSIKTVNQVHTNNVIIIDESNRDLDLGNTEADAMVSKIPDVILGILTADCCPILFADPIAKVIGAAHAGWKGALAGIIKETIIAMEKLGAARHNIRTAIGPAILWDSYEVDSEFRAKFIEQSHKNEKFFKHSKKHGHYMFDLKSYAKQQLLDLNITEIDNLELDTYSMEETFFSCRRAYHRGEGTFGNQMSAICIRSSDHS